MLNSKKKLLTFLNPSEIAQKFSEMYHGAIPAVIINKKIFPLYIIQCFAANFCLNGTSIKM